MTLYGWISRDILPAYVFDDDANVKDLNDAIFVPIKM